MGNPYGAGFVADPAQADPRNRATLAGTQPDAGLGVKFAADDSNAASSQWQGNEAAFGNYGQHGRSPNFGGGYGQAGRTMGGFANLADAALGRGAVQIGAGQSVGAYGDQADARRREMDALGMQRDAALGLSQSVAQQQMLAGAGQQMAAQQSLAHGMGTGLGAMAAMRNAQFQNAQIGTQTGNNLAALRAQEMAQGRDAYFGAASGYRGQDIGLMQQMQERERAQAQLEAQQRALNDQTALGYLGTAADVGKAQLGADASQYAADRGVNAGYDQISRGNREAMVAGVGSLAAAGLSAAGSMAGSASNNQPGQPRPYSQDPDVVMSDERVKYMVQRAGARGHAR